MKTYDAYANGQNRISGIDSSRDAIMPLSILKLAHTLITLPQPIPARIPSPLRTQTTPIRRQRSVKLVISQQLVAHERVRIRKAGIELHRAPEARNGLLVLCLLYTSPSPRDGLLSRMPSSA